jgi:hypothetical protein
MSCCGWMPGLFETTKRVKISQIAQNEEAMSIAHWDHAREKT